MSKYTELNVTSGESSNKTLLFLFLKLKVFVVGLYAMTFSGVSKS